jgi:hypothetical protein
VTLAVFCGGASWSLADAGRAQTASKLMHRIWTLVQRPSLVEI